MSDSGAIKNASETKVNKDEVKEKRSSGAGFPNKVKDEKRSSGAGSLRNLLGMKEKVIIFFCIIFL